MRGVVNASACKPARATVTPSAHSLKLLERPGFAVSVVGPSKLEGHLPAAPSRTHVQQLGGNQLAHAARRAGHQHSGTRLLQKRGSNEPLPSALSAAAAAAAAHGHHGSLKQPRIFIALLSGISPLLLHARAGRPGAGAGQSRSACRMGWGLRRDRRPEHLNSVRESEALAAGNAPAAQRLGGLAAPHCPTCSGHALVPTVGRIRGSQMRAVVGDCLACAAPARFLPSEKTAGAPPLSYSTFTPGCSGADHAGIILGVRRSR